MMILGDAFVVDEPLTDVLNFELNNLANQAERIQENYALIESSSLEASSLWYSFMVGLKQVDLPHVFDQEGLASQNQTSVKEANDAEP